MSTLNANVYNRRCTNVVIHYLPFKVLEGDILFGLVIFKSLSVAKLYIDYSVWWRLHCHQDGSTENMQTSHDHREKTHQVCSKWDSLSRSKTHNELIFPSLLFYSVRGDIDIHTSQQALCQFPSLIQICSEWSTNPSAVLAARMIARPVWRENYKSNSPGDLFSFCVMSMHKTSLSNFDQMKYFPPSLCFLCAAYRLSRFMQLDTCMNSHGSACVVHIHT